MERPGNSAPPSELQPRHRGLIYASGPCVRRKSRINLRRPAGTSSPLVTAPASRSKTAPCGSSYVPQQCHCMAKVLRLQKRDVFAGWPVAMGPLRPSERHLGIPGVLRPLDRHLQGRRGRGHRKLGESPGSLPDRMRRSLSSVGHPHQG